MTNENAELPTKMHDAVRAHWKAFLIEGILLVIFGLAAIVVPPAASLAVTILLGWLFLISGIAGLALTFWAREMPGFWWSLISAALAVLAGIVLLAQPAQGTLTLTIVVGAYFLAEGVATIMYALEHRRELSGRWSWMLIAGLMDLLIAAIIITGLPGSALWAIGLLVGINLLFGGATLIGVALAARNASAGTFANVRIKGPLAAAANTLDLAVELCVLFSLGFRSGGIILALRHLVGPRLAVTDRCGQRFIPFVLRDRRRTDRQHQKCGRHQQFSHLLFPCSTLQPRNPGSAENGYEPGG
jgi:uncharacterized membrane protein HdeD (DUF308 family)